MSKNYSAIKKIIVTLRFFSENKFSSIGPIYYEYGSMVITFDSSSTAVVAYEILKHRVFEDKKLLGKN
jgi:diacylglycerol kinase (ATP)